MSEGTARVRRVEVLVAPLVTFAAVVGLLIAARYYERLPVQAPPCGFKTVLGIPCVGCGGTRAMMALVSGRPFDAVRFNPAVVAGVFVSALWAVAGVLNYRRGKSPLTVPEQNRRIKRVALIALAVLTLNWIYLILFLK
jgi:hypothetical protein